MSSYRATPILFVRRHNCEQTFISASFRNPRLLKLPNDGNPLYSFCIKSSYFKKSVKIPVLSRIMYPQEIKLYASKEGFIYGDADYHKTVLDPHNSLSVYTTLNSSMKILDCYGGRKECETAFEKEMAKIENSFIEYCNKRGNVFKLIKTNYNSFLSKKY